MNFFLQTKGTAIGTTMAVCYSIIFMHMFESKALASSPKKPLHWFRFIDDVFMVWNHSAADLSVFVDHLISINPAIEFTHNVSNVSIAFLDVLVSKNDVGCISNDLFVKPTDTHQFLHADSAHPNHTKKSWAFS